MNHSQLHTISCRVRNRPGVLARISGLFARRGYNIDSLAVSRSHVPGESRMTIAVAGAQEMLAQIIQQLIKLIDVIEVHDHTADSVVERELAMAKVSADADKRPEILQLAQVFRARAVDVADETLIFEVTGASAKIDAFEKMMDSYGICEMVRTGKVIMARGNQPT
ncbi:MAG: acetolactate synthase small subunit [Planctomycetota bacterium]|nr:acetolactate synthase small subunit [Planctomycetota bacterium]MDA1141632.1 acetolactate synthase small subunit [Planctomycetota bacterium]